MESRSGLGGQSVMDTTAVAGTLAQRNSRAPGGKPRVWGMLFTVLNDPAANQQKTYQLKYGFANTNIFDNANWTEFTGGGGGSTVLASQGFETDGVQTVFTLTDATGVPFIVEVNGNLQRAGIDYNVAANVVTFVTAPDISPDGTDNLFVHYATSVSVATDFLERVVVDTSGANVALDFASLKQKMFVGSVDVAGNKTFSLTNSANALVLDLHINVTGTRVLTFPASFVCQVTDARWNNGAKQLTITDSRIEITATFDGTLWKMKVTDDFYDA